jgi:hypothetical protein
MATKKSVGSVDPHESQLLKKDAVTSELLGKPVSVMTEPAPVAKSKAVSPAAKAAQHPVVDVTPAIDEAALPRIEFSMKDPKSGGWYMRRCTDPDDPILSKVALLGWRVSFVIPGRESIRMDIKQAMNRLNSGGR